MQFWLGLQRLLDKRRDAVLAAVALLAFGLLLTVVQYLNLGAQLRADLQVQADLVARMTSASLVFDNRDDAAEILGAFNDSSEVVSAVLRRRDGSVLSGYERLPVGASWVDRAAGEEMVTASVIANNAPVGRLELRARRSGVWWALLRFIGIANGMLVAALGVAWFASGRLRAHVREAERRTRYLALNDALTDLPNRAAFGLALERAVLRSQRHAHELALLLIDLDHFKQINEQHGHAAGDLLLQTVAQRLRGLVRSFDQVARLAGDEFAVLLDHPVDEDLACELAGRIVRELPQPVSAGGIGGAGGIGEGWLKANVSCGIALLPRDAHTPAELMQCADAAMLHAKRQGKDGFQLFTPEIGEGQRSRQRLEQDLREALLNGELQLAYQPLFDAEGRLVSFEGLSRWQHAQRGWVSPAEFVAVAESSGLIVELGINAIEVLKRDLDAIEAEGIGCPPVAINLSSRQCRRPHQRDRFLNSLQAQGLGPNQVEFELTESSVFEDLDKPDSIVLTLQSLGYVTAIDDFGTGYSSLAYLRRMRCRKLKIDRLFVHGLAASTDGRVLVESIVRVAHAMQMQVVAEGIELEADRQCLIAMGCDLFQGFGLSRPLQRPQMLELLRRQAAGERAVVQAVQPWYADAARG